MLNLQQFECQMIEHVKLKSLRGGADVGTTWSTSDGRSGGDTVNTQTCMTTYNNGAPTTNDPNTCKG